MALTLPTVFDHLLARLSPGDPRKSEELYQTLYSRLLFFFESRGTRDPDVAVDKTLDTVERRLSEGAVKPEIPIKRYIFSVAGKIAGDQQKKRGRYWNVLREWMHLKLWSRQPAFSPDFHACLDHCLMELPELERVLIRRYYLDDDVSSTSRTILADELGITLQNLRVKWHRTRNSLEKCMANCLKRRKI